MPISKESDHEEEEQSRVKSIHFHPLIQGQVAEIYTLKRSFWIEVSVFQLGDGNGASVVPLCAILYATDILRPQSVVSACEKG